MKKSLKLLALLLSIVTLFSFSSCNNQEPKEQVPTGMKVASVAGADYRLFVPQTWNLNTSYGISGAYLNLANASNVSVNKFEITEGQALQLPEESAARNQWYFENFCFPLLSARALNPISDLQEIATTLDGENARRYSFSANINQENLHYIQVLCEKDAAFYLFSFVANDEYYDLCIDSVEQMLTEFRFDVPYEPKDYAFTLETDANAPAGMKLASNKEVAYLFYVPESWEIDLDTQIYAAYCSTDRANVSVSPYLPAEDNMSVADYWSLTEEQFEKIFPSNQYEKISETATTLGGKAATAYEYKLTLGAQVYHYLQVVCVYKTMIYNLTYTAKDADYSTHLSEVDTIISAFSFR